MSNMIKSFRGVLKKLEGLMFVESLPLDESLCPGCNGLGRKGIHPLMKFTCSECGGTGKREVKPSNGKERTNFILMPNGVEVYNGSRLRCDMLIGPCCCGAWHKIGDWKDKIKDDDMDRYIEKYEIIERS